jgi:arylsulfatase A-like enzyme
MTGMYPTTHGAWTLGTKLDEAVPTLGDYLRPAGYRSFLIGKAHFQPLASTPEQTSVECQPILRDLEFWRAFNAQHTPWYGFDHVELARNHADESHVGQHYALWMEDNGLKNWRDYFQEWPSQQPKRYGAWDLPSEFHYTTWTAERTVAQLETHARSGQPFFGWASFHDPHPPYVVPEPWASMYDPADMEPGTLEPGELEKLSLHFQLTQKEKPDFSQWRETEHGNHGFNSHLQSDEKSRRDMALYYGMISFMDEHIGRILDTLNRLGMAENTLVIFTTDHGHFLGQHGLWHKGAFHYEDVLRLPFLARWPGRVEATAQSNALQSLVDLAPTFLSAAGQEVPCAMQGVNQLEVWQGKQKSARAEVLVEFHHQPTKLNLRTYIDERWKITIYRDQSYGVLFDLLNDPEERRNLWDESAARETKHELFQKFLNAELRRAPMRFPRIAGA